MITTVAAIELREGDRIIKVDPLKTGPRPGMGHPAPHPTMLLGYRVTGVKLMAGTGDIATVSLADDIGGGGAGYFSLAMLAEAPIVISRPAA